MNIIDYIWPVIAVTLLCAGWVGVQLLARKAKTKNHFDDLNSSSCGSCTCGGIESCENKEKNKPSQNPEL